MPRKKSFEEIKSYIESNVGYFLLSKKYVNGSTKLYIKCPKGHEFRMSWNNFKHGYRCQICKNGLLWYYCSQGENDKAYQYVKEKIESVKGYFLVSQVYSGNKKKLEIKCPKGHIFEMTSNEFINHKRRCPICSRSWLNYYTSNKMYDEALKYVRKKIEKQGYELLTEEYRTNRKKLKLKCPRGHEFLMSYDQFQGGRNCPVCSQGELWYYFHHDKEKAYQYVKDFIESKGYHLLSKTYPVIKQISLYLVHWVILANYGLTIFNKDTVAWNAPS